MNVIQNEHDRLVDEILTSIPIRTGRLHHQIKLELLHENITRSNFLLWKRRMLEKYVLYNMRSAGESELYNTTHLSTTFSNKISCNDCKNQMIFKKLERLGIQDVVEYMKSNINCMCIGCYQRSIRFDSGFLLTRCRFSRDKILGDHWKIIYGSDLDRFPNFMQRPKTVEELIQFKDLTLGNKLVEIENKDGVILL